MAGYRKDDRKSNPELRNGFYQISQIKRLGVIMIASNLPKDISFKD